MEERREGPPLECDLIMKGGITSGVVYPRAILALKKARYRFRNIGGGSVGAIAAALTAAAELGDGSGREDAGFKGLDKEQKNLQEGEFLLDVFRAPKGTRPVLDTVLGFFKVADEAKEAKRNQRTAVLLNAWPVLLRKNPLAFVLAALAGVVLGVLLVLAIAWVMASSLSSFALVLYAIGLGLLLGLISGPLGVLGWLAYIVFKRVPGEYHFGLCIGSGEPGDERRPLLTDWLSGVFDRLAAVGGPLTFGDLEKGPDPENPPEQPYVTLRMLSTNLNQQEPYVFPRDKNTFLFKERDMERFFPAYVVRHLVEKGEKAAEAAGVQPPGGYHFLPRGDDLPVIVPVRMAISFPILLSAVPLYSVRESSWAERGREARPELHEGDLQKNLFSDGGICSNFPIHFFDSWLPGRPTFGINLTEVVDPRVLPTGDERASFSASEVTAETATATRTGRNDDPTQPWLPRPDAPDNRLWKKVGNFLEFFAAILNSARDHHDNAQARLPSYQERVVQVPLRKEEGGLNLGMKTTIIKDLADRGDEAAEKLLKDFRFDEHRWVRLRVLMNQLETQLEGMHEGLRDIIKQDLTRVQLSDRYAYGLDPPGNENAAKLLEALDKALAVLYAVDRDVSVSAGRARSFPPLPEDPQPTLRITPDV